MVRLLQQPSKRIIEAIAYVSDKHDGQVRKFTGAPYATHCMEVYLWTRAFWQDEDAQIAALLHDVIEDTDATYDDIEEKFGRRIADLVWVCTDTPLLRGNMRRADKLRRITQIPKGDPSVFIQLADVYDNVSGLIKAYVDNGREAFDTFGAGIGIIHYYTQKTGELCNRLEPSRESVLASSMAMQGLVLLITALQQRGDTQLLMETPRPF